MEDNINNKYDEYFIKIDDFNKKYYPDITKDKLISKCETDGEIDYYYYCFKNIDKIKKKYIPELNKNNYYNAVLFILKKIPHFEFIIRNLIITLGATFSYTIICNNKNYKMIKNICKSISENIILIKTNIKKEFGEEHNNLLLNPDFWESLVGEKILILHKNSIVLNNCLDKFIKYDYVGNKYVNIRTKNVMIDILKNNEEMIDILKINEMEDYKIKYGLTKYPEHLYVLNKIKNIAEKKINNLFIYKNDFNVDYFAVYKIWINYNDWKDNIDNIILNNNFNYYNNKYYKYKNLEIVLFDNNLKNIEISKNVNVSFYNKNFVFVEDKDYLFINGNYDIKLKNIEDLYEHFNNCYCNIISPIILKDNKLEYFGSVINNEGNIINIDEEIIKYQHITMKLPVYYYIQNTMFQYANLYIIKNIKNILSTMNITKINYLKKSYKLSKILKNVKVDPFVVITNIDNNVDNSLENSIDNVIDKIKFKNKNILFPFEIDKKYLKDIYNNYTKFNLMSFKFFNNFYYLSINKKKTILLIEETIITPDKDCGSLYIYYMLITFLQMGFNVHFLPTNFYCDEKYTRILQKMGIYVCYNYPYSIEYHIKNNYNVYDYIFICRITSMIKTYNCIKKYCKKSKLIFITHDLNYLRLNRQLEVENNNIILDNDNITEKNITDKKNITEKNNNIKNVELEYIQKADISIVVSKIEYNILTNDEKLKNIEYIPICYELYDDYNRVIEETRDIYFIGSRHPPNIDAVEFFINNHWNKIKTLMDIKFHIIGSGYNDVQYKYKNDNSIIFHGFITDEILPEMIKKYRINIVPLRFGAGIKGKILQSSNLKIPCISSKIGVEGMEMINGQDIIVSNFDDNFYIEFEKIYNDIELLKNISDNSYNIIKTYYSLEKNKEYMEDIFNTLDNKVY